LEQKMPIYEYRCAACGFQKEYLQKISDTQLKDCPECGKPSLAKMVTAAGFQLKGSGWYATDFKTAPKSSAAAKSDGGTAAKSDDTSAAKGADKPAAAGESKSTVDAAPAKSESSGKPATTSSTGTGST
jgi:putative FmdB family regulatory protein